MTAAFTPTRDAALAKLRSFVPKAGRAYAARRNFDLGPGKHNHVSCLSPYLRCRLLTEEEVLLSVLAEHSYPAAEKFIQEVYWRTYWKGWLELRPGVWDQYQTTLSAAWNDVQTQGGLRARWEEACRGETGIDCFDAWARELADTGYLHNHARMWFASIWIFTLKLPWVLGADFFLRHLLDGDPASNTLGWRWVAGLQTQGKTYLARASNIAKFTEGRFHPKWQLAGEALPLTGPPAPAPRMLPEEKPVAKNSRTGFLFHDEDLSPDFVLTGLDMVACAALEPQTKVGPLHSAQHVVDFRTAAQDDTLTRWAPHAVPLAKLSGVQAILEWARHEKVEQIVTAYAPVGPTAAVLSELSAHAEAPRVIPVIRSYDRMTWPRATKGFFQFKKNIPDFNFNLRVNSAA